EIGRREVSDLGENIDHVCVGDTEPAGKGRAVLFDRCRRDPSSAGTRASVSIISRVQRKLWVWCSVRAIQSVEVARCDASANNEFIISPRMVGSDPGTGTCGAQCP